MAILPTPTINHHILPSPENPTGLFILHLAGRSNKARAAIFAQINEGRQIGFAANPAYREFWRFRELFARHQFAGVASLQTCLVGMGPKSRPFLDALLFHFPYMWSFTIIRNGAPALWTAMKQIEEVGEKHPDRMNHFDVNEYLRGETMDGDKFVDGVFCDIVVLSVESGRHFPVVEALGRLARSGMERMSGNKSNSMGYSPLKDTYFVWLFDRCDGGEGAAAAAAGLAPASPKEGDVLDNDDEHGTALAAGCELLSRSRDFVANALANPTSGAEMEEQEEMPTLWSIDAPGAHGLQSLGEVALGRVPRNAFSATDFGFS